MAINLKGRSFLKLLDFTKEEIHYLLNLSKSLKEAKLNGKEIKKLCGKNIALLFQKDSTRTRCAFEVGAYDQGACVTYLGPSGSQFGKKESVEDTAKVLGRMYDAIQFRGYKQSDVEMLYRFSKKPVFNGLTDEYHPTQILADFLTILEVKNKLEGLKIVFCGDCRNNVATELMIGCSIMGINFVGAGPKQLWPDDELISSCKEKAKINGSTIEYNSNIKEAMDNADVIYTDVWLSMGEEKEKWKERINLLSPYQVNYKNLQNAKKDFIFLHCLPSFHDLNTEIGKEIHLEFGLNEMEVTNEIFNSEHSLVFEEAENRMHTIKAIMVATMS